MTLYLSKGSQPGRDCAQAFSRERFKPRSEYHLTDLKCGRIFEFASPLIECDPVFFELPEGSNGASFGRHWDIGDMDASGEPACTKVSAIMQIIEKTAMIENMLAASMSPSMAASLDWSRALQSRSIVP